MKKLASLSMKTLGFTAKSIRKMVEDKGEAVFLGRIAGVAGSFFTGESANGEYTGFKGQFAAVNKDGEQFEAAVCFVPAQIANPLRTAFEAGSTELELLADVYAIETDKNASGYAYLCEPVLSDKSNERLKQMKAALTNNLPKQIAAPVEEKTEAKAKAKAA